MHTEVPEARSRGAVLFTPLQHPATALSVSIVHLFAFVLSSKMASCKLPNPNVHDYTGTEWKLREVDDGRQVWEYIGDQPGAAAAGASDSVDRQVNAIKKMVDQTMMSPPTQASNAQEAVRKGIQFYSNVQQPDGHWAGDYGGPMFLMPGTYSFE